MRGFGVFSGMVEDLPESPGNGRVRVDPVTAPKIPKTKYPDITRVRSEGRWMWRACPRIEGSQRWGPRQMNQEDAHADARRLRALGVRPVEPRMPRTLSRALNAVVKSAEDRGIQPVVLNGGYEGPARALQRIFGPETLMESLNADSVRWMIRDALDRDIAGSTVRKSYLRMLHLAFGVAGLPSPVPEAREDLKHLLRYRPPVMPWFAPDKIRDIIHRIRTFRQNHALRKRERDADLVTLIAYTGIRSWELSRVQARDVDVRSGILHVRKPKVRDLPRDLPLHGEALSAAKRLIQRLESHETIISARALNGVFETWKERLGEPNLNGRALRHSYATGLLLTGATLAECRDLVGHAQGSSQTVIYLHTAESHLSDAARRLSLALEGQELAPRPGGRSGDQPPGPEVPRP